MMILVCDNNFTTIPQFAETYGYKDEKLYQDRHSVCSSYTCNDIDYASLLNDRITAVRRCTVYHANQIDSYMSNDLTTKGITSIASLSDKTVRNGTYLKNELENLQSAIEDARGEMTQSGISMN